jgi:phosphopantetheinyl transferase
MRSVWLRIPAQAVGEPPPSPSLLSPAFVSPRGEPALVAWTPAAPPASRQGGEGARLRQAVKESLALFLAEHLLERQISGLTVEADSLGQPRMWLGAAPGPALSLSWSAGRLWGAVGRSGSGLGLDAAAPEEFPSSYPHRRVFKEAEWQAAVTLTAGDGAEAAALLWSVKEAVVKAMGCGFHFAGPKKVHVQCTAQDEHGYFWWGSLDNPDQNRPGGREACSAISVRLQEVWLTVAWHRSAIQPVKQ